ncbi:MAG: hypothetical protein MUF78_06355 [Candidatus Edwardsbacteria bacterium]|jgi:hypothetical protein|nr:hypothetical protein [Candidatus Edwardsbacteria bacterium]
MPDEPRDIKQEIQKAAGLEKPAAGIKVTTKPAAKLRLPKIAEISVWLDTYDDLFSDFDPRPYEERVVSDDFLREAKAFGKEKRGGQFELVLLVPHKLQDTAQEEVIVKRLHEFFADNRRLTHSAIAANRRTGLRLVGLALVLLLAGAWLRSMEHASFLMNFFLVVLEPGGWFTIWNGFDRLFFMPSHLRSDLEFYDKMSACAISFIPY